MVQKYFGEYVQLGIVYFRLVDYLVLGIVYHIMRNGDVILLKCKKWGHNIGQIILCCS